MPRTSRSRSDSGVTAAARVKAAKPGTLPTEVHRIAMALPVLALPDPVVARLSIEASGNLVEKLGRISFDALADAAEMNRRWADETVERLADLARPPERPEDVVHAIAGFMAAQGDLATQQVARIAALAQRFQIETLGVFSEAGRSVAEETVSALQGRSGHSGTRGGTKE